MTPATAMASGAPRIARAFATARSIILERRPSRMSTPPRRCTWRTLGYHRCAKLAVSAQVGREIVRFEREKKPESSRWQFRHSDAIGHPAPASKGYLWYRNAPQAACTLV